jgi:hypothetical protein
MDFETRYNIDTRIQCGPLEVIDLPGLIDGCQEQWQNLALCQVNASVESFIGTSMTRMMSSSI